MDQYIIENKKAWEEAFEKREASWGTDIVKRVESENYAFFNNDTIEVLRKYDLKGKTIGQFCCNNGRELLSLVKTVKAEKGIGFDIAENMVSFANEKARCLKLPCEFIAANILEIGDDYKNCFDMVVITIGALCWFKDLHKFFQIVSKCMKKDGIIIINEQHPMTNMIADQGDEEYNPKHPLDCVFSYFDHEWVGNGGMYYITGREYDSHTFTDYTHSISEIIGSMCANKIVVTNMQEFDYDIAGNFGDLNNKGFPLSMILEGIKTQD